MPFFQKKKGKMLRNLSPAAVGIGAYRVNANSHIGKYNDCSKGVKHG